MMKVRSSLSNNNMNSPVSLFIESEGSRKRLLEAFEPTVLLRARGLDHLLSLDGSRPLREQPNPSAFLLCSLFPRSVSGC
jgi:hypothetical protein